MKYLGYIFMAAGVIFFAITGPSLAAQTETISKTREYWDLFWLIANFFLLSFLLVKLAKKPLKDFVVEQRESISQQLAEMEDRKKEVLLEQSRIEEMTFGLNKELEIFEEALFDTAAKEHEELLKGAERESKIILERAGVWTEQILIKAKQRLKIEMLDQAIGIASNIVKKNITEKDIKKMFVQFNQNIARTVST